MLKANTGQEKSDESPVKGEAGQVDHGLKELAEECQGQKDTEEHAPQSDQSEVLQDLGQSNSEEASHGFSGDQTADKQNVASEDVSNQEASESDCVQDTPGHMTETREANDKITSISETAAELAEDGKIVQETPPVTSELSETHVETALPEEGIEPANQEKSDPCESTMSLDAVQNDSECAVQHQVVDDATTDTVERVEQPNETVSESGKPDSVELKSEPSGPIGNLTQREAVEDPTMPATEGIAASSELPSVSDEKSAVSAVTVSSESPLPDSQSNGCIKEVEPAGDQKRLVDYQLEGNEAMTVDPFSYTATYDSDASQVDSTNQLNQTPEELSDRPPGGISGDPPDGAPEFSDPSVYMVEDASEPVLDDGKVSVQGGHPGHSADSLHDMGAQGVTLSIPEDSVLTNDPPMGDTTLMAPGIETDGNPGTRVLLLQRQTDDGSLVQEYVEVPNVTDGDGNLIVYDEMGNQYIIPPSQADADPPMAEEVITNETEVVTTGEDHLMHDGLVLDDVELPVAQESPDDSSDHVVVERLQYQDVSYLPSHARNDVQMSVEIGEDEEDSEGEIGHDYINNDVNHVVVHHSELLDHDLSHGDLQTAVSFDTHPLGELPIVPQGSATSKKRKRQMDRVGFDGKPAVRKRKKKPKTDEMKDLGGAPLKVTNNFMEPLATSAGTLSFPHHSIGGSNFRSSVMPVSPIRIPVPEMSEDSKDCSHRKVRTTSGSSLLGSPTLQPPETPSQKSHSPIQNKHPTIASLLFKGSTSVSPAVSPRSSSSSPFSATAMVSPNLPPMMSPSLPSMTSPNGSVFHGNTAPIPSVSNQDNAKSTGGVVEQVCKMLPVRPPGWQPQYTTAQQGLPYVKTVTSAVTDAQDLSHTKTRDNFQNASTVHEIMTVPNMPPAAVGAPVVSSMAPILKIPVPEFRASGPHQPVSAPMPHQTLDQEKFHTKVAEIHRPGYDPRNSSELSSVRHPQPVQGPFIPTSNQGTLIQQKPARPPEQEKMPIVITPVEERLPPPYPGHSQANKATASQPEAGPHARQPIPVTAAQPSGLVMVSTEKHLVEPPVPVPSSVAPCSSGSRQASQAMKSTVPATSVPQGSANGPIQTEGLVPRTATDIRSVRLPIQAMLPHGKVPPLMFPPGVLPPPHLIRGVPPGHAVPIELVRGQRPAFISPTGHILIPTDQLHLLQQGRLLPRPMMHGPPQFVRPQVPLSAASPQPIRPAEPIGLAPAPVTPPVPSPRTPDVAEEQQSMEAELVKAAHMAEVGQTAASHVNQADSRSHVEPNLPNLPTLSASMKQPPQVTVKPKPPRQVRHQPEPVQSDTGPTPTRPQSTGGEGSTLADKYMKDWQPTGRYKCKFCHYSSVTQNFLFRHWVMSHSGVKPYLCAFCNLKSPTKDGITRHQTAKHKELPREVLIDVEQEKLLVRKFRKVFTSLVPYRYHDYGEDEVPSDAETSGIDDHNSTEDGDQREVLTLNSYGKSHENSKGITETYIYPNSHVPDENAHPGNSGDRVHGIPRIAQQCEVNQLHRDSFAEGQRPNETRSYPVLKKKIRESFEEEKDTPEDMRIRPTQHEFSWPNEEPTSRLSELAGIALSSQAPPPHTLETDNSKRLLNESHEKKNSNSSVVTSSTVRPPIAIHPALQRPQMMLPPLDTLIRPQMLQHPMPGMVHPARPPYLPRDVTMSLPSQFVPIENQPMNMYDKDMLQSAMAKHKDAQTIVQLLVSQKHDLPPDLQLPGSRKVESSMPNPVPQPPPAHQHGSHHVPFSSVAHSASPSTFVQAMSSPISSYALSDGAHVGLPTMAGMLKSPVITTPNKISEAGPYRDLPHLVLQKTHTTAGSLPPINELRSSAGYSGVGSAQPVPSSSAARVSSVSSTSATAVLLAAAAAAKSDASTPEQDHTVETTSETMSSSPHVTSTSEEPVDGNANKTSREDLQLKRVPVKIQTIDVPHSNPSPDQSQDAVKTTSNVNSTLPEVTSS